MNWSSSNSLKKTKKNQTTLTNQCLLCWTDWFGTFLKLEPRGEGEGIYVYPSTMGLKIKELVLKLNQPEVLRKSQN